MSSIQKLQKDLKNVLLYTQDLIGFKDKIIFDISSEPYPYFLESALSGLEGVHLGPDADTWLKISRLRETVAPAPDPIFKDWVKDQKVSSPDHKPVLLEVRVVRVTIDEVSELAEADLIDEDDVLTPPETEHAIHERDVVLRLSRMDEFRDCWDQYIRGAWAEWAQVEKPRRESIQAYNKIYQVHQRIASSGEDNAIEVIWGLGVARWLHANAQINIPLLEQQVELDLLEDGSIDIRPRHIGPTLALKAFHALEIEGSKRLQNDASERLSRIVEDPDQTFSPFEKRSFETILRSCAAQLSATGIYVPDGENYNPANRILGAIDENLKISDTWVIYVRQRAEDFRKEDIRKLISQIEDTQKPDDLPPVGRKIVEPPSNETSGSLGFDLSSGEWRLPDQIHDSWAPGTSDRASTAEGKAKLDFFLPLPSNEDQRQILQRLEEADGVLVQGPPGTGKTHTIANVICHFLATGKRVLVTAKTSEALRALHEKLPSGIRDLAISVIHNDREGATQLERAVEVLANEAKQIREKDITAAIIETQQIMADTRDKIEELDLALLSYARLNLERIQLGGAEHLPMDLARMVASNSGVFAWLNDEISIDDFYDPKFTEQAMSDAREIRAILDADLEYDSVDLPRPQDLMETQRLLAAHASIVRDQEIETENRSGPHLAKVSLEEVKAAHDWIEAFHRLFELLQGEPWLVNAYKRLGDDPATNSEVTALRSALETWTRLEASGREYALRGMLVEAPLDDKQFDQAVLKLSQGEKPFGLFAFGASQLKLRLGQVQIAGDEPKSSDDWNSIRSYRVWQSEAAAFIRQWNSICAHLDSPSLPTDWENGRSSLMKLGKTIGQLLHLSKSTSECQKRLERIFPYGLDVRAALQEGDIARIRTALKLHLEKATLSDSYRIRDKLRELVGKRRQTYYTALGEICEAIGNPNVPASELGDAFEALQRECVRLDELRPSSEKLEAIADLVRTSGAPQWAHDIYRIPPSQNPDIIPHNWAEAWDLKRAATYVQSLGNREELERLTGARREQEQKLQRLMGEVVRLRTFLGLKRRMSTGVEVALAKFAAAIARLGAGTGKSASRHRRVIRDATLQAAEAVPCWILPEWRVSEQLPPQLAGFDLVIVDEASQSDITSLPAILRGKKLLIVGDDKQVSPMHVGLDERTIIQLRTTYLNGLPFADQMDPATSLYELGGMLFPGKAILLREHFRCVEPIIRFSTRFYQNLLVPMRLPKSSERLDPPLVDIFVRDGEKIKDTNRREAEVIVDEIKALTENEKFSHRSIGVISLIGDKQAKLIYDLLTKELGADLLEKHRIVCGSAAMFQGQERDIVFLSMVACPKTSTSQQSRMYKQRFNVAMSRARDRLVLVRSVSSSDLKTGDLKLQVIEHFRDPIGSSNVSESKDILEACDSDFERNFGARLIELGYRLRPQVPVAGFKLDFVIEGENDARLAVELDGDKWHGPDRWAADFNRQVALERLGWVFWRCWGSSWIADPQGCIENLVATLECLNIKPIGAASGTFSYCEFREAKKAVDKEGTSDGERSYSDLGGSEAPAAEGEISGSQDLDRPTLKVQIGDLVVIRYNDEPSRTVRIRLSDREHKPDIGVIHVNQPLAAAVLGRDLEDEIEVSVGGGVRQGVIEHVERPALMLA